MEQINDESKIDEMINDINKEFFDELLKEIHDIVMVEAIDNVRNNENLVNTIKTGWPGAEGQLWIDNFNNLSNEVVESLENYYGQVEGEINRLLTEWEEYKKANDVE